MAKKQQMKQMALKDTTGDKIFYIINGIFLAILALIVLYPLYFIVIAAISDPDAVLNGDVVLYPVRITMEGFAKIMERKDRAVFDKKGNFLRWSKRWNCL